MIYKLEIDGPNGQVTYDIHSVTLRGAEQIAIVTGNGEDFGGVCTLTIRAPHQPDILRRCDSTRSPWYWLESGQRLAKGAVLPESTLRKWGCL